MKNKNILQRLDNYAVEKGLNDNKITNDAGLSVGLLGKSRKSNGGLSSDTIEKLLYAYTDLNAEWLLTGKGAMLKDDASIAPVPKSIVGVPLIPIEAIAGYAVEDGVGIRFEDCEYYSVPEFKKSGVEFLIRVSGSSMYPKYSNGDILACKKVKDIIFFQWGKVYVIDSSQGQLVKRIFEYENADYILLVSDNKEKYPSFPIPKSDIRSLSIVLGVIRME